MKINHKIFLLCTLFIGFVSLELAAQSVPSPGAEQTQTTYLVGGTIHIGNGEVIENGFIGFENGKIISIGDATSVKLDTKDAEVIETNGKHIYPGLISPNSRMGLEEIGAVRASRDHYEVGKYTPEVRTLIAYNTDSRVTPTIRSNGVLIAQIKPNGGRITGTSSVVSMDAWNWEDALIIEDGVHINWPNLVTRKGWWAEPGGIETNKKYDAEISELKQFFGEAKAYCQKTKHATKNLKFEAMRGIFAQTQNAYIHANSAKAIIAAVNFSKEHDLKTVIVGGRDAWLVTDLLKQNNIPIILAQTHRLPFNQDSDIDMPFKLPALLQKEGILFCMTAEVSSGEQRNLPFFAGKAVAYGLDKEEALSAITANAAQILGVGDKIGTLEIGKDATIVISKGDILDITSNHIEHAFVQGRKMDTDNKQKHLYRKFMDKFGLPHQQN